MEAVNKLFGLYFRLPLQWSHEKKYFRVTTNNMVKCRFGQQQKMMDYDYREEYLKGVISNKILLWQC